jgi:adenosine deaminase CECR1
MMAHPLRVARLALLAGGVAVVAACATRTAPAATPAGVAAPQGYATVAEYRAARERLIQEDRGRRLGAGLVLTAAEEAANTRLMALKQAELDRTRDYFPPAHSFLRERTKEAMAGSRVLEVMRRLPKGGVLHAHGGALGDFRWLVANVTYRPDCYMYVGPAAAPPRGTLRLADQSPGEGWRLVRELRAEAPDAAAFDAEIYRSITFGEEDLAAPDIWVEFSTIFRRVGGVVSHPSVGPEYWRNLLAALIDENVQYLESRSGSIDQAIIRDLRGRDSAFGVKFIAAGGRSATRERLAQGLKATIDLRVTQPDRVAGFDLVEEEDRGNTNLFYLEELLDARHEAARRGVTLPFFLHSGESNWAENENLYDAILLGATRIGHGLALFKHPRLMEIVKERNIAIEVCPLSNQMLGYVPDLRNHPAVLYINAGLPVVLSSDDPAIMRHSLSHDFYVAFMAWGLDLRSLKQLAMNSLIYSAMSDEEKRAALAAWETRWQAFVAWVNQGSGISEQGSGIWDQGSGIRDLGSGIWDQGLGIRD